MGWGGAAGPSRQLRGSLTERRRHLACPREGAGRGTRARTLQLERDGAGDEGQVGLEELLVDGREVAPQVAGADGLVAAH
jgi:hypothetical protein